LDRQYTITELNGTEKIFTAKLTTTKLVSSDGFEIPHYVIFNEDRTTLQVVPTITMPSEESITFSVTVGVYTGTNNAFLTEETKEVSFITGEALTIIPEDNIAASYPVNGMRNFYKSEYALQEGYIQLITGQSALFSNIPDGSIQQIRLTDAAGQISYSDFTYDPTQNKLAFPLPANQLQNEMSYHLEVIQMPADQETGTTTNSTSLDNALVGNGDTGTPTENDNATVDIAFTTVLYSLYFRVSQYNTFTEKLQTINELPQTNVFNRATIDLSEGEVFDDLETIGTDKYDPLVSLQVDLHNDWIQQDVLPAYQSTSAYLCNRPTDLLEGLEAAIQAHNRNSITFTVADFEQSLPTTHEQKLIFQLDNQVTKRYATYQQNVMDCSAADFESYLLDCEEGNCDEIEAINSIMDTTLPAIATGTYRISATYKLPNAPNPLTLGSLYFSYE